MQKTALHQTHLDLGAKMGAFSEYDMPLYYDEGIIKEHLWVRQNTGLFDVSHMGQIILESDEASSFLERITPSSFQNKQNGQAQYTVLLNENGGIIDDLIVTRLSENKFFLVGNAGRNQEDLNWIGDHLPAGSVMEFWQDHGLLALQGPQANITIKETLNIDASNLSYMHLMDAKTPCGTDVYVSRLGYTGEDGFEISVPEEKLVDLWNLICEHNTVKPIGLAARDSLRLDMGYPLYGHDIDETTSPIEARLNWIVSKKTIGYFGYDRIQDERTNGVSRIRTCIKLLEKGVARQGTEIRNEQDEKIGLLTSGGFSPSLDTSIGQGYIDPDYQNVGTKIFVNIRGRNVAAEVAGMSLLPAQTKSNKKSKTIQEAT